MNTCEGTYTDDMIFTKALILNTHITYTQVMKTVFIAAALNME
jgi:hypothetical protein